MGRGNRVNRFAQRKRELKEKANNSNNPGEKHDDGRKPYVEIIRENADFEGYYKEQGICPPEEWSTFMATFKKDLPSSFRITSYPWGEAQVLKNLIKSKYFSELISCKQEDGEDIKPTNLPWYPHELAWQLQLTRSDIRRSEPLYRLHNFLVAETATGGVSRQETVSMIPPLVLDVRSDSRVLDMCASPGSKTVQLLEFLHSNENETPTGFVIANDVDNNRCYMLIHQTKRLNSPCLAITNADASLMPTMYIPDKENGGATKPLTFDRILCDVPCSGDGTLRKNPDIWMKWNPVHANHLHGVQYRILRRGCELLSIGGRLVYSTCSLNPVEDEAVIYRLLKETGDTMTLVDIGEKLPGLKYQEGLSHWKPASKDMVFYDKPEDIPQKWSTIVRASMFPPPPEEADKYKLNKCIRILPHYQNTGGFFVAALEKVDTLPWQKDQPYPTTNPSVNSESNPDNQPSEDVRESKKEPPRKRRKMDGYREDPFVFFTEKDNNEVFTSIREYYDIKSDFDTSCLLTRCHIGKKNNVYMVTPTVRDFVRLNENKIKIINIGVKTFVRSDSRHMTCPFRLSQEGLQWMLPYIGPKRRVTIPREDLIRMLVSIDDTNPPLITAFSKQTQEQITDKDKFATGSCVLEYSEESSPLRILRIGWRGAMSFRAYANKTDTVHYLRLLGEDVSKYEINKFKKEDSTNPETATEDNVENSTTDGADKNGEENGVEETDAKI